MPSSLLRSAPRNAPKFSQTFVCCRTQAPIRHENSGSRSLATVHPGPKVLTDVWFTGSAPRRSHLQPNSNDPKPDERTVKLGNSKQRPPLSPANPANMSNSPPHPTRTPANSAAISSPAGNPLPADNPASLPLHPPPSPHGLRPRRLLRRPMDFSHSLGANAPRRQRQA